jgi:hypothetical protein
VPPLNVIEGLDNLHVDPGSVKKVDPTFFSNFAVRHFFFLEHPARYSHTIFGHGMQLYNHDIFKRATAS